MTSLKKLEQECPNLPWCTDDIHRLGPVTMDYFRQNEVFHRRWAVKWFENFQFVYGNHHLKWSRKYDCAINTDFLRRDTAINQKSKTNITREITESLASMIFADSPTWEVATPEESNAQGK